LSDWRIGEDAKTMTPVGAHRGSGGGLASEGQHTAILLQNCPAGQKAIAYTDLLGNVDLLLNYCF